jgi:hypothetical protein
LLHCFASFYGIVHARQGFSHNAVSGLFFGFRIFLLLYSGSSPLSHPLLPRKS